jgi:hypothetical protein
MVSLVSTVCRVFILFKRSNNDINPVYLFTALPQYAISLYHSRVHCDSCVHLHQQYDAVEIASMSAG